MSGDGTERSTTESAAKKPARLRLAFYGDDFTGSTDALEVLAFAGLRCALFLRPPTRAQLDELGGFDAIGIAGDSRAMSPAEMDDALPAVFRAMSQLGAPLLHYKVCSTFDSSPTIGSIGHVMEIARRTIGAAPIPLIAGTPALQRYCLFGNLFARSGTDGQIYRIDRHPIMRAHPVTPMDEGDLIRHFGRQTALPITGFNLTHFDGDRPALDRAFDQTLSAQPAAILFDTANSGHLTEIGRLLDMRARHTGATFTVGSSGVEYALTQWWAEHGELPAQARSYDTCTPAAPILAMSGSASPVSAAQIDAAIAAGFTDIAVDARALVDETGWQHALQHIVERASEALRAGRSVMMHTARGPNDPRVAAMIDSLVARGLSRDEAKHQGGRLLGQRLGSIAEAVLKAVPLRRLILSGGDTSSQVTQVLGPDALEIQARLAPGAPLCRVMSNKPHLQELEVALKGGQMGGVDYFVVARAGRGG
ncbi:four-carbon acid sugar kinase family protein [Paraburkholderia sp. IW21]|uniref:four-carbon acid sugar kinase family protein n=1 Tax=Paraburkholderia sp. IW21 TaxID=3242488 RepID=UPI003520F24D